MPKVERKIFEKVVIRIISSTDKRELIEEFSKDPIFFCFVLSDISKGKDSPNYHVLKELTRNKEIIEQFVIEQAKSILSYFAPDELKEDYCRILNNSQDASAELSGDPIKRTEHDTMHFSVLPVVVEQPWWMEIASKRFAISALSTAGIVALSFYATESDLLFGTIKEKIELAKEIIIKESSLPKPEGRRKKVAMSDRVAMSNTEKSESVPSTQEIGGIPEEEKKKSAFQLNEVPKLDTEETPTDKPKTEEKVAESNTPTTTPAPTTEGKATEPERKPVKIEELLPGRRKWILDFSVAYANINTSAGRFGIIQVPIPGGPTISIPSFLGEAQVNQDFISYLLNLRYGVTRKLEVFAFTSFFSSFQRATFNNVSVSETDNNFQFAGVGTTYQIRGEDRYPALLATASTNIVENTKFPNGYKLGYFKDFAASITSYYTVDPIVFFLLTGYNVSLKRTNGDNSIDPGDIFSLSPQVTFVVNPLINLTWGFRFTLQGPNKVNGQEVSSTRTSVSPLFGFTYGIGKNIILSLNTEYLFGANFSQPEVSLVLEYRF